MKKLILIIGMVHVFSLCFCVDFIKVNNNIWIHRSYARINGYMIPSNGMIYQKEKDVVLIDTAWDDKQTKEINDFVAGTLNARIVSCIITHAHIDRLGGVNYLRENGIDVYSTELTNKIARLKNFQYGNKVLVPGADQFPKFGISTEYLGAAHSEDNIIVFVKKEKVLFGGCLIKSKESQDLGDTTDANIGSWKEVVGKVKEEFGKTDIIVIPGHGNFGDATLIDRTIELLSRR